MTRRLYYDDGYTLEFEAALAGVRDLGDGRVGLVLEETLFYPTSGGQLHDLGQLGGLPVVDVVDEDEAILHVVETGETDAPAPGARLRGEIDGNRRAHHRQQHSGQHLLSRVVEDHLGWTTISSRLGETMNSLEIAAESLSASELAELEDRTNRLIWQALPVEVQYLDAEEARRAGLRKKVKREGRVRIIRFADVESCACGGTHVRNSAEVGLVVLTGTEKIRGGTRIHFLCGQRAVEWRRERVRWLESTALRLSTGMDLVEGSVERLLEESKSSRRGLDAMARELVRARATKWRAAAETIGGHQVVLRLLEESEGAAAAEAVHAITKDGGLLAICVLGDSAKCQALVGRGDGVDVDCGALLSAVMEQVGGRGGGRPDFARGGATGIEPQALVDAFRDRIVSDADH